VRTERDALGPLDLPDDCLYGIHTVRALVNFGTGPERHDREFVRAYLLVKKACALANAELGYLDRARAQALTAAIDSLIDQGRFDDVVVNPVSGGAGTSLNMNINEVIANTALVMSGRRPGDYGYIHPIDHVNMHQSTNDTYPSALRIAMLVRLNRLEDALVRLQGALQEKERAFSDLLALGRTELMDALPMTWGMRFGAWAEAVGRDRWRIFKARERIKVLNLGGTAIGTGFNAPQRYIFLVTEKIREVTNLAVTRAENMVEATQNQDAVVEVSGLLRTCAVNLMKISEDMRLLASGPSGGIGEVVLKALQEGSSIMPGKINPVMCEHATQVCLSVMAYDWLVANAVALGNLELSQFLPLAAHSVLKAMSILEDAVSRFCSGVVEGLGLDREKVKENLDDSVAVLTYLAPVIGHEAASEVYTAMRQDRRSIRQILADKGIMTPETFDELVSSHAVRRTGYRT